jgi:pimeloyl-ACP methyl ester carboxylesterase
MPDALYAQPVTVRADSGYFRSFDGRNIYYETHGAGFPVLLVHGFIVNSSSWKRTALYDSLVAAGYKVILADLRGNGKSDRPHSADAYQDLAQVKDLFGLLRFMKVDQYDLVGYSRGSIIAAVLLTQDTHVRKAVLGGIGTGFTDPEWPRRKMFARALAGEDVPELRDMVAYVKKSGLDQEALMFQQQFQPSLSPAELSRINKPVLVIAGDQDSDNSSAGELARLIPNATLASVPGVHNTVYQTVPFAQAIRSFLRN